MIDEQQIRPDERRALDELGANFDALLARTPEPVRRRPERRRLVLAGVAMAVGVLALGVWAAWPGDSTVDTALGGIAEVAAEQDAPDPKQFVASESITTNLTKGSNGYHSVSVAQEAWLSMALPGAVKTRIYASGSGGSKTINNVTSTRPLPTYRIGGDVYRPSQIAAFADNPEALIAEIEDSVAGLPQEFRAQTEWKFLIDPLKAIAPPLPSSLRAAMIRELQSIPGVEANEKAQDSRGRDGVSLKFESDGVTSSALFDADDAQVLSTETKITKGGAGPFSDSKPGQVLNSYTLISSRVVDAAPRVVPRAD